MKQPVNLEDLLSQTYPGKRIVTAGDLDEFRAVFERCGSASLRELTHEELQLVVTAISCTARDMVRWLRDVDTPRLVNVTRGRHGALNELLATAQRKRERWSWSRRDPKF